MGFTRNQGSLLEPDSPYVRLNSYASSMVSKPTHTPLTLHRFAAPSGPWPWHGDLSEDEEEARERISVGLSPTRAVGDSGAPAPWLHKTLKWQHYPQNLYPNWTISQVQRCGIKTLIEREERGDVESGKCTVYGLDVLEDRRFSRKNWIKVEEGNAEEYWSMLKAKPADDVLMQCFCVDGLSGNVLRMLGSRYNIEPFFFSSFLNRIPAIYQEDPHPPENASEQALPDDGDHITIILPFVRVDKKKQKKKIMTGATEPAIVTPQGNLYFIDPDGTEQRLINDLLSIHLIRSSSCATLLTLHAHDPHATSAKELHGKLWLAGQSVYWQKLFRQTKDSSFLVLICLWHVLYMWDEGMDLLYRHVVNLEARAIDTTDIELTKTLHSIRARLPHYDSLLVQFRKSIEFIRDKPNPLAENEGSRKLLERECEILMGEVERLRLFRGAIDQRLGNIMNLVFNITTIQDSVVVRQLTEAALRDSEAMKQISYLTMLFLPASFVNGIFGMNIHELADGTSGSVAKYVAVAVPLTAFTIWIAVAFQSRRLRHQPDVGRLTHLFWPLMLPFKLWEDRKRRQAETKQALEKVGIVEVPTPLRERGYHNMKEWWKGGENAGDEEHQVQ